MVPSEKFAEAGSVDGAGADGGGSSGGGGSGEKMYGSMPQLSRSVWEMTDREAKRFTNPMYVIHHATRILRYLCVRGGRRQPMCLQVACSDLDCL